MPDIKDGAEDTPVTDPSDDKEVEVDVADLSDEDLEKTIDGEDINTPPPADGDGDEIDPKPSDDDKDDKEKAPKEDGKGDDTKAPEKDADAPEETLESLRAKLVDAKTDSDKLTGRLKDKEAFISRQGNHIGDLRKEAKVYLAKAKEDLEELWITDPAKAEAETVRIRKIEDQIAAEEVAAQQPGVPDSQAIEERATAVKDAVNNMVDDFDDCVPGMIDILKEDGLPADVIQSFAADIFRGHADPGMLIHLAHRAKANTRISTLETENADLKQRLKDTSGDVSAKIKAAANNGAGLTGKESGGAGSATSVVADTQIENMTDDELTAFLKEQEGAA
ncbi:MAG: hypothetical protein KAR06_04355 [Deltaproteobacteria bacterium]|nr:hypothetical protein [Deltaproteobacteria bacterium]